MTITSAEALSLLDWKRRIFDLYASARADADPRSAWERWKATRDEMYRSHERSPVPESRRDAYSGAYYEHDPRARVVGTMRDAPPEEFDVPTSGTEPMRLLRIGFCDVELFDEPLTLEVYWLTAYAGGLFLPFRDGTSGDSTYGAGRYLLDTVKGSDLGAENGKLVLDFNFAYNPSCAYDPRWVCPLAPPPNRLDVAIEAGEKTPAS